VQVCERVRMAIEDIRVLGDGRSVSASLGVAVFPDDAPDAARLIRNADRALYRAKANGRNRVEVFSLGPSSESEAPEQETPERQMTTSHAESGATADRSPGPGRGFG
jgi:predicted signal transduction protein with EAL and GGDEF domain